jgi:transposase-like protein
MSGRGDYFYLTLNRAVYQEQVKELLREVNELKRENAALKAVLAEVEKQTGQVREILRVAANNMAVLHHE